MHWGFFEMEALGDIEAEWCGEGDKESLRLLALQGEACRDPWLWLREGV